MVSVVQNYAFNRNYIDTSRNWHSLQWIVSLHNRTTRVNNISFQCREWENSKKGNRETSILFIAYYPLSSTDSSTTTASTIFTTERAAQHCHSRTIRNITYTTRLWLSSKKLTTSWNRNMQSGDEARTVQQAFIDCSIWMSHLQMIPYFICEVSRSCSWTALKRILKSLQRPSDCSKLCKGNKHYLYTSIQCTIEQHNVNFNYKRQQSTPFLPRYRPSLKQFKKPAKVHNFPCRDKSHHQSDKITVARQPRTREREDYLLSRS